MIRGLVLVLAVSACARGVELGAPEPPTTGFQSLDSSPEAPAADEAVELPALAGDDVSLDAAPLAFAVTDADYQADAVRALLSLVEASGAPLMLDPFGMPVYFVPEIMTPKGPTCAFTELDGEAGGEIYISLNPPKGCPEMWKTLRHEIGCHAAGDQRGHTESGICAESGGGPDVADFASLAWMCESVGFDLCPLLGSDLPAL